MSPLPGAASPGEVREGLGDFGIFHSMPGSRC